MAYLHACSGVGMKSELDLFSLLLTKTSIAKSAFLHYKHVSSLTRRVQTFWETDLRRHWRVDF